MSNRTILVAILLSGFFSVPARADHFTIDLEVKAGGASKTVKADKAALGVKAKERQALTAKAGATMTVKWTVTSTAKTGVVKDVLVHFFVVRGEKLGQASVPKLDKDCGRGKRSHMDFKTQGQGHGRAQLHHRCAGHLSAAPGNHRSGQRWRTGTNILPPWIL